MDTSKHSIGVFDSGLGGLWILKYLEKHIPNEQYIFFADQAHMPYGNRTPQEIAELCFSITDFLISKGCALVVVACNTATSAAIVELREKYPEVVFVGIEPAVKPASVQSQTGHIGVLATKVTAEGKKLRESIEKISSDVKVHIAVGYGLVELVEEGKADTDEAEALLRTHLQPLLKNNIDQLVLGCTHYSFLTKRIRAIVGETVTIVDPAPAVAKRVEQLIEEHGTHHHSATKEPEIFTSGPDVEKVRDFYRDIKL